MDAIPDQRGHAFPTPGSTKQLPGRGLSRRRRQRTLEVLEGRVVLHSYMAINTNDS
jgi:hypothetical protein